MFGWLFFVFVCLIVCLFACCVFSYIFRLRPTSFLRTLFFLLQMTFVCLVVLLHLFVEFVSVLIYEQVISETYFLPLDLGFLASDDMCLVGCFATFVFRICFFCCLFLLLFVCFIVCVLSYFQVISETYFLWALFFLLQMTYFWSIVLFTFVCRIFLFYCFCWFVCVLIYFQVETYFLWTLFFLLQMTTPLFVQCFRIPSLTNLTISLLFTTNRKA